MEPLLGKFVAETFKSLSSPAQNSVDLKMEVYTPALELIGFLEIQRSVIWSEKAFSAGKFSVESLITTESMTMLKPENIIWIEGETAGIIETVLEESGQSGPYITASGPTLTGILDRRVLWGLYNLKGTPPEIMHHLVDDCCINPTRGGVESRKIPGLVLLDAPTGGDTIQLQATGGTLLERLETLGETYGVAFGVRFNPAVPQMEFWTRWGQNRSIHQSDNNPVLYSTELDDVLSSEYTYNSQDYRNVALVAGEGEGTDRIYVTVENEVEDDTDIPAVTPPSEPGVTQYTVTLLTDPEGGGTVSGGKTVAAGVSVTVTASPAEDYTFVEWRENGVRVSGERQYTFTVNADRTLTAVFAAVVPMYTITATVDPSGSGNVTGAGQYQEGATVNLKATENEGYTFTDWKEGGNPVYAYNEDGIYISKTGAPLTMEGTTGTPYPLSAVTGPNADQQQNLDNNRITLWDWLAVNGYDVSGNPEYTFPVLMNRDLVAAFAEKKPSRLPDGYQELQYVDFDGATRINNAVIAQFTRYGYELDCELLPSSASGTLVGLYFYAQRSGVSAGSYAYSYLMTRVRYDGTNIISENNYRGNSGTSGAPTNRVSLPAQSGKMNISFDANSNTFSLNGLTESYTPSVANTGYVTATPIQIGCQIYYTSSTSSTYTGFMAYRFYELKTVDANGKDYNDLIPCRRTSDGVVGLYDLVQNKFNAPAAGTLIAGPAV